MTEERLCDNCGFPFDWEGVQARGYDYCCEPCSRGEDCICPEHDHDNVPTGVLPESRPENPEIRNA